MQFSLTPYVGAMTFFINFYRIAAYGKQIRCLAYAPGSTSEVCWAVLCTVGVSVQATGGAARPSGWRARWEPGLRAGARAAPAAAAGPPSSRRPPRPTAGIPEGPAAPGPPSAGAFLSRWGCAALSFPNTCGTCNPVNQRVCRTASKVYFACLKKGSWPRYSMRFSSKSYRMISRLLYTFLVTEETIQVQQVEGLPQIFKNWQFWVSYSTL